MPCGVRVDFTESGGIADAQMVGDTEAAVKWMRAQPGHNGKVGLIGSCSGGRHAFVTACSSDGWDAVVELWGGRVVQDEVTRKGYSVVKLLQGQGLSLGQIQQALAAVDADYDFVLIDCPPSLSMLTLNGLCAAHGVIVPMQCEYFALEGLTDLVNTIKQVHANLNKELKIIALLRVMFDPRITLQMQVSDQLKAHFGDKVFDTVIPRNVRLAEAPSYGLPGVVFDPSSRGAQAFIEFAKEMVARIGTMK